ncbi:MAG: carbohydrate-binding protein [Bacteroidota bacterium]
MIPKVPFLQFPSLIDASAPWCKSILLLLLAYAPLIVSANDVVQAESYPAQMGNAQVSSQYPGFTGSGYVTQLTSEWSYVGFDKSNPQAQPAQLIVRYANGNPAPVTHLALQIGSGLTQMLSFPSTGSWDSWEELTINFTLPAGYQNIRIDGQSNSATSVNIDRFELQLGVVKDPVSPGAFNQNSPSNNSIVGLTPNLSWSASSNADNYTVVIATNSNLSNPIVNTVVNETAYTINGLSYDTTYYWGVTASNGNGTTEASNAGLSFTTEQEPVTENPPGAFALNGPQNGSSGVSTSPNFSWGASIGATSYTLMVSTNSDLSNPIIIQSMDGSTYSASGLDYDTTYYWGVTAVNNYGTTTASNNGFVFTTTQESNSGGSYSAIGTVYEAENLNYGNVVQQSDIAGYSGSGYLTQFNSEWSYAKFENSYSEVTTAQINFVYNNATGANVTNINLKVGSQIVQNLVFPPTASTTWSVLTSQEFQIPAGYQGIELDVISNTGNSISLDLIDFVIGGGLDAPPSPPGAFTLNSPNNGSTGLSTSVTLNWSASLGADSYQVRVSANADLSNPVFNQPVTGTATQPSGLLAETTYFWNVTAINDDGEVAASNGPRNFTTEEEPMDTPLPGAFTIGSPSNGAENVSVVASFNWGSSSNADTYNLIISTNSNLSSPLVDEQGITENTYWAGALSENTTYYWSVTAVNAYGATTVDDGTAYFTTEGNDTPTDPGTVLATFEAEEYDAANGVNISEDETFIWSLDHSDWIRFNTVDFGGNPTNFTVNVAVDSDYAGQVIEVRLDAPTGTLLGSLTVASTNGWNDFVEQSAELANASGIHDLYIVFKGSVGIGNLDWIRFENNEPPGEFDLNAPANGETDVAVQPDFSWSASQNATSYTLIIATDSGLSDVVRETGGITETNYVPEIALTGNTTYYWTVRAYNGPVSTQANSIKSFTTFTPPLPAAFALVTPGDQEANVARIPTFGWNASEYAESYEITVATNSAFSNPIISVSDINNTFYAAQVTLNAGTTYYWRVKAVNTTGSRGATASFSTGSALGTNYYVATDGIDAPGQGTSSNPFKTVAYAAQFASSPGSVINIGPGSFTETEPIRLAPGVDLIGAGESLTTLYSTGVSIPEGIDPNSNDWKLWYDGSLIQLISPRRVEFRNNKSEAIPPTNGDQSLSGFTIDGGNKSLKVGVWVENRNNVTMHHVTIQNCQQRGAVFGPGDKDWYIMPEYWMYNTTIHDVTFIENGTDIPYNPQTGTWPETLGNLCLAALDGADIYNVTIDDQIGYGIKFIYDGFFKNVKIHDCSFNLNENDNLWGEKIAIEQWNLGPGNEIYNIQCNTWLSIVNHPAMFNDPQGTEHMKIYNVSMIDQDGVSSKEGMEIALPGCEVYDNYIENKGFAIAIWDMGRKNVVIRNNIFRNTQKQSYFSGAGTAVHLDNSRPWDYENIKIVNNVFDSYWGPAVRILGARVDNVDIANNIFLNTRLEGQGDIQINGADLTNVRVENNLKYNATGINPGWEIIGASTEANNIVGNPNLKMTGAFEGPFYQPSSSSSVVVDGGKDVGFSYSGSAPDIGKWEFGFSSFSLTTNIGTLATDEATISDEVSIYPVPTSGTFRIDLPEHIVAISATDLVGRSVGVSVENPTANHGHNSYSAFIEAPSGIYHLTIQLDNGDVVRKLILVRK